MGLVKDICKRCLDTTEDWNGASGWTDDDDRRWNERGIVWCPVETTYRGDPAKVNERPPKWCKYQLEHMLSSQEQIS